MSSMIRGALEQNPNLVIVIESRSNKVDSIIKDSEIGLDIQKKEYTIPNLNDSDIEKIIHVLDKGKRLGELKGKNHHERVKAFKEQANRQLIVAMYQATSGKKFGERAKDELEGMDPQSKIIYAIVSSAGAYRFRLQPDEIIIACNDSDNSYLNKVKWLVNRKLIFEDENGFIKARHRYIANMVYTEIVENGSFDNVLRGILQICASKITKHSDHNDRVNRILRTFINYRFIHRTVGSKIGKNIYSEYETPFSWNPHYWLHRGALELEEDNLELAENFLGQARSLNEDDFYVQTEWAYLLFKKAIQNPGSNLSEKFVEDAKKIIEWVIVERKEQSAHAYHILGQQGLNWCKEGIKEVNEKYKFLSYLKKKIEEARKIHHKEEYLEILSKNIERTILELAVN